MYQRFYKRESWNDVVREERNLAWVSMNLAPLDATRISQAKASSNPAVMAKPLIAPMIGFRNRSIWITGSVSGSFTSPLKTDSAAVKSTPEQKDRPDPVKITTCTDSSASISLNAFARSTIISLVSELRDFGRLIVMTAIPPDSFFTWMRFSDPVWSIFTRFRSVATKFPIRFFNFSARNSQSGRRDEEQHWLVCQLFCR